MQCPLLGVKRTSAKGRRRLKIREREAEAQGLHQLASDLRMAIMELERLERSHQRRIERFSQGDANPLLLLLLLKGPSRTLSLKTPDFTGRSGGTRTPNPRFWRHGTRPN